ncbi:MAG: hypothetical protein EHM72_07640 [Calditrichaeota bacterium]|nr:MAG: hypothetical protein EHM72_07640 [Calditrichota bacterium]
MSAPPRVASIDIGTNSTRLLIVEKDDQARWAPILYQERMTLLGEGLGDDQFLSSAACNRVLDALSQYQQIIEDLHCGVPLLFATSATRDASNRFTFLRSITERTGWICRVLSGEEEGRLSLQGALYDIENHGNILLCDIGGGSTEFTSTRTDRQIICRSLDLGSSRLTRQFIASDPPTPVELQNLTHYIQEYLRLSAPHVPVIDLMVATGGTAFTLALMDLKKSISEPAAVHHHLLYLKHIQALRDAIAATPLAERKTWIGLHPDRAHVILAGAAILVEILEFYHQSTVLISLKDLLLGIVLEQGL